MISLWNATSTDLPALQADEPLLALRLQETTGNGCTYIVPMNSCAARSSSAANISTDTGRDGCLDDNIAVVKTTRSASADLSREIRHVRSLHRRTRSGVGGARPDLRDGALERGLAR